MYKLFSVDDHIMEPAHTFTEHIASKFKDRAPRVVVDPQTGHEEWTWEGAQAKIPTGLYAAAGRPSTEWNKNAINFDGMIRGCWDPVQRAKDFLSNGICASAAFPTLAGFSGHLFLEFPDMELAGACVEAYNNFVLDEWCQAGPKGMHVPLILGKIWDPEATVKEIERCIKKGARGLTWMENPVGFGLPSYWSDHWDPVWRACEANNFPVCMHIGTGNPVNMPSPEAPDTLYIALSYMNAMSASMNLAMSPVCRKFPGLKLVFSEGGIGWLPAALERADFQWVKHGDWTGLKGTLPSEIVRRNMYFCMIQEPWGFQTKSVRDFIGEDHIFWESDYPHADTPWPNTQTAAKQMFDGVDPVAVEKASYKNAEKVFNWTIADPNAKF